MTKPSHFQMLPANLYPITMRAYRTDNNERIWEESVREPETLVSIQVPNLRERHGVICWIEVIYGDGCTVRTFPDPDDEEGGSPKSVSYIQRPDSDEWEFMENA